MTHRGKILAVSSLVGLLFLLHAGIGFSQVVTDYDEAVSAALFYFHRELGGSVDLGPELFKSCAQYDDRGHWFQNVLVLDIGLNGILITEQESSRTFAIYAEPFPPNEELTPVDDVVMPRLVFQEFLTHEKHRDPGRGQEQGCCNAGTTTRVPRACIRWIG